MTPDCRVHYAMIDGGGIAPNVVQATAKVRYSIRSPNLPGMRDLVFYTKSAETFEARVEALQSRWPAWRLAGAVFYDPLWMQYREMP